MRLVIAAAALLPAALSFASPVAAGPVAMPKPGQCMASKILATGTRLEGVPDSGSYVRYDPGTLHGVSYDSVPGIVHSKVGDKLELCLVSVPKGCPPGDNRGRVWLAVNLRTQEFWQLPDAEHMCGGA